MPESFAMFLNGSYGVGKSTVLEHLGDQLAAAGTPFALMDVDWFHRSGPRQLVLSGVIETPADRERYERATGLRVRSVRLEVSTAVREARLRRRYSAFQQVALDWHLQRHEALAQRLRGADLDELVVDAEHLAPAEVATTVRAHLHL